MLIDRLAVIGVGLIGGSLARALRKKNKCGSVIGFGRDKRKLQRAVELNVIDDFSQDIKRVVREATVIVLATPLSTTRQLFIEMLPHLRSDVIITDVGSVKGYVVDVAREVLQEHLPYFVPGHPIAGTEKSGVEASFAELFESHRVILTPLAESNIHAIQLVTQMWEATGAEIIHLEVEHHDEILAATSHLPHMLAYSLVDCLSTMQNSKEVFQFAAGGFADFTRIASSHPTMWQDICMANREQLLKALDRFNQHTGLLRTAIENNDGQALLDIFSRAKQARDRFTDNRDKGSEAAE